MAQGSNKLQIVVMSGVATSSETPFTCPIGQARVATIVNRDAGAVTVSTDDSGSPSISIAAGASFEFKLSDNAAWIKDEIIFFVSGNVSVQPTVVVGA